MTPDACEQSRQHGSNPFASRNLTPGVVPYMFDDEASPDRLIRRLRDSHWRGQIVGPHGSGKSTLVHTLLPLFRRAGLAIAHGVFRAGRFSWRCDQRDRSRKKLVVIDGFEQFPPWHRWLRRFHSKWSGWGLLVTAHDDMGLPLIHKTRVDIVTARRVVQRLISPSDPGVIAPGDVEDALATHPGDLRSTLFALYDLYELRRRRPRTAAALRQGLE